MNKLLTIVIPSYNVEKTLRQTVESLLVPDIELRSLLDILIVNDGSKDGTLDLAQQLEAKNPGIVRVWDKENGGHGSTINVGIDHGYGKYMKIVDGDDWLETDALEKYIKILCETDADIVATDYYHYSIDTERMHLVKSSVLPYGEVLHVLDVFNDYTFYMLSFSVKTSMLREQPCRIDEHCYYVDVEFDTLVALTAKTLLYVDMRLYVYRLSYAGQSVSVEGWMKHYLEHERVVSTLIGWYKELILTQPKCKGKINYLEKRLVRSAGGHYGIGLDFPSQNRQEFLAHLRDFDEMIKQQGPDLYKLTAKKPVVRVIRLTHFSYFTYLCLGKFKRLYNWIKKTDR